ncbi:nucleolysin TIAR-like [Babylonia areolata]|uniref:nucleolysin TIAR-like n=1 Tax=Babylonia areolata TaxID=304850 RepID=UPI003FCF9205
MRMHPYLHVHYVHPLSAYPHHHHHHHHHHQPSHHLPVTEMRLNWAVPSTSAAPKTDTSKHFHIFVGDLSQELEQQQLRDAFCAFGEISDCKIIRDPVTQKSKGYGFVSFVHKQDAEQAISGMNGQWLGSRPVRTNWATRRSLPAVSKDNGKQLSYDDVYSQSSDSNCTVYCGGITKGLSEELMRSTFQNFGTIQEVRIFKEKGFAFVRFSSKEAATNAICSVHGTEINEQVVKCSWGKESNDHAPGHPPALAPAPVMTAGALHGRLYSLVGAGAGAAAGGGGGGGGPTCGTPTFPAAFPSAYHHPHHHPTPTYPVALTPSAAPAHCLPGGGGLEACVGVDVGAWPPSGATLKQQQYGSLAGVQWGQTVNTLGQQPALVAYAVQPGFLG